VRLLYDGRNGAIGPYQTLPDSYYAFTFSGVNPDDANVNGRQISVLATPGGVEQQGEPASRIVGMVPFGDARLDPSKATGDPSYLPFYAFNAAADHVVNNTVKLENPLTSGNSDVAYQLANPNLSSVRLVAGDGDADGPSSPNADGFMDWAVGVQRSTGQGVAYTTTARSRQADQVASALPVTCTSGQVPPDCKADTDTTKQATLSRTLLAMPTYALNGFQIDAQQGVGWAVGDKGAIVRLGGEGTVGSSGSAPPEPPLGSPSRATPPATQPYDGFRQNAEGAGAAGPVPSFTTLPPCRLARHTPPRPDRRLE
jgi:hypothetical protein